MSDQLATHFGVKSGVLVARVRAESPAAMAGITAGDVITSVNGTSVTDAGDVAREVRRSAAELALPVVRDKKDRTLTAKLPAEERERRVRPRTRPA